MQSLIPIYSGELPYYWTSNGRAEVEFIMQLGKEIVPIEVKAESNINGNSLSVYTKKYNPDLRIRFSILNLQYNSGLLSAPAPMAAWLPKLIKLIENLPNKE